ncbi:hypothetical protein [Paraburkholderia lacunae]|uniref:Uncharacterized protein n=1 Tax=Paraburkholderia lacunae TaxID=2211104 RepID=A0A370N5U9_9BURK|nr:hypothetical protein [Paraburkholderia lacunae]RDK00994.1 hypothetical protein DLM46_19435 [Paraburkholderia lacunae]
MIPYLSGRENEVEYINSICLNLFDTWCENRSVTPLGYLLHCWPLLDSGPRAIRRLGDTLRELRKSHPETLNVKTSQALRELADCVDEILAFGLMPERITANG